MPDMDAGLSETDSYPVHQPGLPRRHAEAAEADADSDGGGRPIGAGLPPAFRMRHARHYVEHLIGDAPLQTVRQLPTEDIVGGETVPPDQVTDLVASIRDVGLLQPLLVTRAGASYELIAGANRLAAARAIGLASVPCLVLDVEHGDTGKLRDAARRKVAPPMPEEPAPPPVEGARADALAVALREAQSVLGLSSVLSPVLAAAETPFRTGVLTGLIQAEMNWANAVAAAASFLARTEPALLELVDVPRAAEEACARIAFEARARGIEVSLQSDMELTQTFADPEALTAACHGLVHALVRLPGATRLDVTVSAPRVRPAVILELRVMAQLPESQVEHFFERLAEHPAGAAGAVLLEAAAASARRQGGRVTATRSDEGLTVSYVVPQRVDRLG